MNHGEEPLESGTVSNACPNPDCQYTVFEYDTLKKSVDQEMWRASNAVDRARTLRVLSAAILYATALFHVIFSPDMWVRAGAVAMILMCFQAMHKEG